MKRFRSLYNGRIFPRRALRALVLSLLLMGTAHAEPPSLKVPVMESSLTDVFEPEPLRTTNPSTVSTEQVEQVERVETVETIESTEKSEGQGPLVSSDRPEDVPVEGDAKVPEPELQSEAEQEIEESEVHYPYVIHEGQIQFQVNSGRLGSGSEGGDPANNGLAPFDAQRNFFVRRFRPVFLFQLTPNLNIDTEFNIDPGRKQADVLDLLINYEFNENTTLAAGRYKVPFGWEGLRSSRTINTVERSDATVYFYPERDIGLTVYHDNDLGEFALGTFLGQPRSNGDRNGGVDVIGRALFSVDERTKIGVSGHLGTFRTTGTTVDIPVRRIGTELQYANGPWKLEGEAFYSDGYNTASRANTKANGYYLTGIYRISEPLDFVVSYDRFDPDLDFVDHLTPSNASNARDRKLIGLNYYVSREPEHRFMLNYEMKQSLEGPSLYRSGFRFRYQIAW